ncbi:MAG: hypothetical protein EB032_09705, partial [Betaproteobacteria bacterium]|nr:hypothetical protein [Betaproteobacteria bacterium]
VGVGVAANNAEYFDEPGMALMLCDVPAAHYRVFSGAQALPADFVAQSALVHADPQTPDLAELIAEMAGRTQSGYLFGGLTASREQNVQFAWQAPNDAFSNPFQETFDSSAQRCLFKFFSRSLRFGALPRHEHRRSDGRTQWCCLVARCANLVACDAGLRTAWQRARNHRSPRQCDLPTRWSRLAFCQMSLQAAKADLRRICAEIREELEPETLSMETAHALAASEAEAAPHPARRIAGAVYVSCSGRGGPHFGGDSAELQWVRHALGDVPLVGFFASGEIAHHHLYGYTGVLTVFTTPAEAT